MGIGGSPFVAVRVDRDALPVQGDVEWSTKNKVVRKVRAYRHNTHVAMSFFFGLQECSMPVNIT